MPPTSFFSSRHGDEDEEDFEGMDPEESVSDIEREVYEETWNRREIKDCPDLLALGHGCLPVTTLQIHYRSKYRELIGYSNAAFDQSRLSIPARHPHSEIRKVRPLEVIRADGVYESQQNATEAQRIVDVLAELWSAAPDSTPSIGVVTFNRKQADLIEDGIEERAESDPAFLTALVRERERVQGGEDMGFFVKNVENVQGDERDVILFSTTFGRDRQGSFKRFFGALGQSGGERRLNVAVTRARQKVILVTSMPIRDISDMLATGRAPTKARDYLQAYLDYASKMSAGELELASQSAIRLSPQRTQAHTDATMHDAFVGAVADYLRTLGHEPHSASDDDTFSIDLALQDPATGQFGLAVECDSPTDHHGHLVTARAREIWRPSVLRRGIPVVHRVSSHGWYHKQAEEKQRLSDAVRAAIQP